MNALSNFSLARFDNLPVVGLQDARVACFINFKTDWSPGLKPQGVANVLANVTVMVSETQSIQSLCSFDLATKTRQDPAVCVSLPSNSIVKEQF